MKLFFAFLVLIVLSLSPSMARRPNVIIIFTDDQGTIDMNCYGARDLVTPHMDALAARGVRFTQFNAAAPVCSPSRTAFFSGVAPWKSGHYHNALEVKKSELLNKALSLAGWVAAFIIANVYAAQLSSLLVGQIENVTARYVAAFDKVAGQVV